MHIPARPALVTAVLVVSVVATACGTTPTGEQPTVPASGSPPPSAPPSPSDAPALPSAAPSTPAGETPSSPPADDDEPTLQVGYRARATADGIAVRQGPGTDQPLISEENTYGEILEAVRLDAGDPVVIQLGPVRLDGLAWYWVTDDDGDRISWRDGGWVAGEYLEEMDAVETFPAVVVAVNGVGESVSEAGTIEPGADVRYHLMAAPPDGASSCEIRVSVAGVEPGQRELATTSISEATFFPEGASEFLSVTGGGKVELTVHTDCTYAATVIEVTQG